MIENKSRRHEYIFKYELHLIVKIYDLCESRKKFLTFNVCLSITKLLSFMYFIEHFTNILSN